MLIVKSDDFPPIAFDAVSSFKSFEHYASEYGRSSSIIFVDFYGYGRGSLFEVAATVNGVTYSPAMPISMSVPQGERQRLVASRTLMRLISDHIRVVTVDKSNPALDHARRV
ncbi:hypothetical protein BV22DRAFT_1134064 [Leucogyrophana mollusca]|uniref:Uncharacterized protein n=1 Tax=Leucogyrophana mollusca TaxID=85980 RepID=A0ACB8B2P4_9AGAM|nr:hypothetical protein BV22DRAFT_1134064 [Leucogyrophana mollusca]